MRHTEEVTSGWLSPSLSQDQESGQPSRPSGWVWVRPEGSPVLRPCPARLGRTWAGHRKEGRLCPVPLEAGQPAGKLELPGGTTAEWRLSKGMRNSPPLRTRSLQWQGGSWGAARGVLRPVGCTPTHPSRGLPRRPGRHQAAQVGTCNQRTHTSRDEDTHTA